MAEPMIQFGAAAVVEKIVRPPSSSWFYHCGGRHICPGEEVWVVVVVVMVVGVVCLCPLDFSRACVVVCSEASWDFKCNAGLKYLAGFVVSMMPRAVVAEPFCGALFPLFLCVLRKTWGGQRVQRERRKYACLQPKGYAALVDEEG